MQQDPAGELVAVLEEGQQCDEHGVGGGYVAGVDRVDDLAGGVVGGEGGLLLAEAAGCCGDGGVGVEVDPFADEFAEQR